MDEDMLDAILMSLNGATSTTDGSIFSVSKDLQTYMFPKGE
jgi:hypothetical protein